MRDKTNIYCKKTDLGWQIRKGTRRLFKSGPGIYDLLGLICKIIEDREKVYSIDVLIKRK